MKHVLFGIVLALWMPIAAAMPMDLGDITGNPAHTETDTGDGAYRLTDTTGILDDATAFLLLEIAGFKDSNSIGIFGADFTMLEIFSGAANAITSATLSWDIGTDTVTNLASGDSAVIDDQLFGFYLNSGDGNTYYSVDALNAGGADMMHSFFVGTAGHPDLFGSNVVLAFEDVLGGDMDYNDMVVGVSDITGIGPNITTQTVPEPGPLALMGLGLLGMAGLHKRKRKL